jgi:hypothetical protein
MLLIACIDLDQNGHVLGGPGRREAAVRHKSQLRNIPEFVAYAPCFIWSDMVTFLYRCPNTGHNVQGFAVDNAAVSDDSIYEVVTCALCLRVHLVNPATGRVAGANAKPGR